MKKLNFCFHPDHLTRNFPQTEKNHTNKKWEIGLMFVLAAAVQRGWKTRGWKNKREMWFLPRMHLTLITCCHASPDKKERNCVLSKDKDNVKDKHKDKQKLLTFVTCCHAFLDKKGEMHFSDIYVLLQILRLSIFQCLLFFTIDVKGTTV